MDPVFIYNLKLNIVKRDSNQKFCYFQIILTPYILWYYFMNNFSSPLLTLSLSLSFSSHTHTRAERMVLRVFVDYCES